MFSFCVSYLFISKFVAVVSLYDLDRSGRVRLFLVCLSQNPCLMLIPFPGKPFFIFSKAYNLTREV